MAVSNLFGAVTSHLATLVVLVPPPAARLLPLWTVAPGARPYLSATDSSQRGLACNPVSGRLPPYYWPDCESCPSHPHTSMKNHGYLLPPS